MNLALVLLFTLLLSVESLWLFALSAHVARFTEIAAPVFWLLAMCVLWATYLRGRSPPRPRAAVRTLLAGVAAVVAGAMLGFLAISSA
jgi:hypothetical protein